MTKDEKYLTDAIDAPGPIQVYICHMQSKPKQMQTCWVRDLE
jgi:hypothetical protein